MSLGSQAALEQVTAPAAPEPAAWPQTVVQPVAAAAVQVPQAGVAGHVSADGLSLASQSASDPVEQVTAPAAPEPAYWPQAVAQPVAAAAVQVPQAGVAGHVLADGLSLASQSASDPVEQVTAPAAPEPQLPSLQ